MDGAFYDALALPARWERTAYLAGKRFVDLAVSAAGLLLLAPLFLLIAAAVRLDSPGPAFFLHERVGMGGKPLRVWKFRTMARNARELAERFTPAQRREFERRFKLADDPRVTRVGAFLRRTSLDELPQLINVLRGEMSLVGPRPVVAEELERYGARGALLLGVRPGITGYWQVNDRGGLSYEARMEMELFYAGHCGPALDWKILRQTAGAGLRRACAV